MSIPGLPNGDCGAIGSFQRRIRVSYRAQRRPGRRVTGAAAVDAGAYLGEFALD